MTSRLSSRIRRLEDKMPESRWSGHLLDTSKGYEWRGTLYPKEEDLPFALEDFAGTYIYLLDVARDRLCHTCQRGYRHDVVVDICPGCGAPLPPPWIETEEGHEFIRGLDKSPATREASSQEAPR